MSGHIIALSGGVGGAKLAWGLSQVLPAEDLSVICNTGDDFTHLGLRICPDLDTVMYTLAGVSNTEQGWGVAGESWAFMDMLRRYGGPDWFNLGDRDLATHIMRAQMLEAGENLSRVTAILVEKLGVGPAILPMSDFAAPTLLQTDQGELSFQHYFVREQCAPEVRAVDLSAAQSRRPSRDVQAVLARPDLKAVILCPSNPFLSIDPILSLIGMRETLKEIPAPVIAVSPLVAGGAIKGPTAKMMVEMGLELTQQSIEAHYEGLIDLLVLDEADADVADELGIKTHICPTVMKRGEDKIALAQTVLNLIV